jgi:hypothetical protein
LALETLGMVDVNSAGLRYEQAAQLEERPVRAAALGPGRFACHMTNGKVSKELAYTFAEF